MPFQRAMSRYSSPCRHAMAYKVSPRLTVYVAGRSGVDEQAASRRSSGASREIQGEAQRRI
jgi:hypothetical protein